MQLETWTRVKMFRCVTDPMIGPKPKQAFMLPDLPGWDAVLHIPSGIIYVKTDKNRHHVVGMGNWASIELYPPEEIPTQAVEEKRGPGRPRAVASGAI